MATNDDNERLIDAFVEALDLLIDSRAYQTICESSKDAHKAARSSENAADAKVLLKRVLEEMSHGN